MSSTDVRPRDSCATTLPDRTVTSLSFRNPHHAGNPNDDHPGCKERPDLDVLSKNREVGDEPINKCLHARIFLPSRIKIAYFLCNFIWGSKRGCRNPKPIAALADDAVRWVVATGDPDDEYVTACLDRHRMEGDVHNTGLKTSRCYLF